MIRYFPGVEVLTQNHGNVPMITGEEEAENIGTGANRWVSGRWISMGSRESSILIDSVFSVKLEVISMS